MLLTVDQVAERLTVSRPTVWRYRRTDPTFPRPIKLSAGCSRWRADAVDAWIAERETADA
jgi:prophage regulatory protein